MVMDVEDTVSYLKKMRVALLLRFALPLFVVAFVRFVEQDLLCRQTSSTRSLRRPDPVKLWILRRRAFGAPPTTDKTTRHSVIALLLRSCVHIE
jgi:hypothetical protein